MDSVVHMKTKAKLNVWERGSFTDADQKFFDEYDKQWT